MHKGMRERVDEPPCNPSRIYNKTRAASVTALTPRIWDSAVTPMSFLGPRLVSCVFSATPCSSKANSPHRSPSSFSHSPSPSSCRDLPSQHGPHSPTRLVINWVVVQQHHKKGRKTWTVISVAKVNKHPQSHLFARGVSEYRLHHLKCLISHTKGQFFSPPIWRKSFLWSPHVSEH